MTPQIRKMLLVATAIGLGHSPSASADPITLTCKGTAQVNLFAGTNYHPPNGDEIPPVLWGVDETEFRAAGGVFQFSHPTEFHVQIDEDHMVFLAEDTVEVFWPDDGDGSTDTAEVTTQASDYLATESGYSGWLRRRYAYDSDYGARPMTLTVIKIERETGGVEFRGLRQQAAGTVGPEFGVEGGTAERFDMVVVGKCTGLPATRL